MTDERNQGDPRPRVKDEDRLYADMLSPEAEYEVRFGPSLDQIPEDRREGVRMARTYMDMMD